MKMKPGKPVILSAETYTDPSSGIKVLPGTLGYLRAYDKTSNKWVVEFPSAAIYVSQEHLVRCKLELPVILGSKPNPRFDHHSV